MSFAVDELARAKSDKRAITQWLMERFPQGAAAWLNADDDLIRRLEERAGSFGAAEENRDSALDVKQAFFKTRRGRVYRALFFIEGADVYDHRCGSRMKERMNVATSSWAETHRTASFSASVDFISDISRRDRQGRPIPAAKGPYYYYTQSLEIGTTAYTILASFVFLTSRASFAT